MKRYLLFIFLPLLLVAVGCPKTAITESDTAKMRKEFSEENYEKNMKAMGKGAELEEEKKRAEQYQQSGQ